MNKLETIRYMGIKTNLLDFIIPEIQRVTPPNGIVLDLMAGSNAVSYALKEFFTVYTNDIQMYSYIISQAVIVNQSEVITSQSALEEIYPLYIINTIERHFTFFEDTYSGTYFSKKQCTDIDSIRYAIANISNESKRNLYLFALMGAMCKVQSTPGHFAQYMPSTHSRIVPLQQMNLLQEFYVKCNLYSSLCFTDKNNKSFCQDFHCLLESSELGNVDTIYLDSPYTQEQYSRFYHILETLVKYDYPQVHFKAGYRDDRFQSLFCYKRKVSDEFESIFKYCQNTRTNLVISYSNKGLLSADTLTNLAKQYFQDVKKTEINYKHSTQGKGSNIITEILFTCSFA